MINQTDPDIATWYVYIYIITFHILSSNFIAHWL